MKKNRYKPFHNRKTIAQINILSFILILFSFLSCNENEFLEEIPLDFYSPENSYVTFEDFDAAIYSLHASLRDQLWGQSSQSRFPRIGWYGTDLVESRYDTDGSHDYSVLWGPHGLTFDIWELSYRLIFDANVIIERSESNNSQLTPEEIIYFKAEAMFFRAFAYNMLANLYGGVPIVLEEIKTPKRDFVRSSRQEVYEQCAKDLEYAVSHLKDIDDVDDSRINMLAASHVLAEV